MRPTWSNRSYLQRYKKIPEKRTNFQINKTYAAHQKMSPPILRNTKKKICRKPQLPSVNPKNRLFLCQSLFLLKKIPFLCKFIKRIYDKIMVLTKEYRIPMPLTVDEVFTTIF